MFQTDPFSLIILLVGLSLLPFVAMVATSYLKIVVVMSLIRNALGIQSIPPNMVINALAMILTFYIMAPVASESWNIAKTELAKPRQAVAGVPAPAGAGAPAQAAAGVPAPAGAAQPARPPQAFPPRPAPRSPPRERPTDGGSRRIPSRRLRSRFASFSQSIRPTGSGRSS